MDENGQPSSAAHSAWLAQSRLNRRRYAEAVSLCNELLQANPRDQAAWYIKARAQTNQLAMDDAEFDETSDADSLLDEHATAQVPRPGTSIARPLASRQDGGGSQGIRPMTGSGRPVTGFNRPGTNSARPISSSSTADMSRTLKSSSGSGSATGSSSRPGTSRPVTSSGRFVRLGTASLAAAAGVGDENETIDSSKLDLRKYGTYPWLARALCDYILHVEHNPRKVLELAASGTQHSNYNDWWWKERLGRAYYQLGLLRDAEKQLKSSLKSMDTVLVHLELGKVYIKLDQPNAAQRQYSQGLSVHTDDPTLLTASARVYDMLNDEQSAINTYKQVLQQDASNVEAIACIGAHHFYADQPEVGLRFYRRLLQMGVNTAELWCNIGLCCFYASQYDLALSSIEHALSLAEDDCMADIWYNVGQVAIGIGDLGLAYQAFKVAVSVDDAHAESHTNLGVLEMRKGNLEHAASYFQAAENSASALYEPFYNHALLAKRNNNVEQSLDLVKRSLEKYSEHAESLELYRELVSQLVAA